MIHDLSKHLRIGFQVRTAEFLMTSTAAHSEQHTPSPRLFVDEGLEAVPRV